MSETPLQSFLGYSAAMSPDQVAINYGSRNISYRELDRRIRQLATGLLHQGVQSGDRVALFVPNCPEAVMALIGCYMIGAVAVPLNYRYLGEEARSVLKRTHAKML
ncbi:MAG: AMP-binding protein, partial [Nitrospirota bacterium]